MPPMVPRKTIQTRDKRAKGIHSVVVRDDRVRSSIRFGCFMEEVCNNVFTSNGLIAFPPLASQPARSPTSQTPSLPGQPRDNSHGCD